MTNPTENPKSEIENLIPQDNLTGLPLLSTWPRVYALVLILFALIVILLSLFTRAYQ